ncbi:hypothetical protein NC653_001521 [Populus alba x Populus x berolinensis]|uniref:Uncharacterized protein n=1 Tax=Populus alba x Populus x berolinensis TaxID=444605 RepID=A0AAD6RLC9_9ROSI|nr:hypothetical protein NC653_001521 [Populus alba x Populus x berolinensis]
MSAVTFSVLCSTSCVQSQAFATHPALHFFKTHWFICLNPFVGG